MRSFASSPRGFSVSSSDAGVACVDWGGSWQRNRTSNSHISTRAGLMRAKHRRGPRQGRQTGPLSALGDSDDCRERRSVAASSPHSRVDHRRACHRVRRPLRGIQSDGLGRDRQPREWCGLGRHQPRRRPECGRARALRGDCRADLHGRVVVATTTTSATGAYSFAHVDNGDYTVRVDAPPAFRFPAVAACCQRLHASR